ncbi:MAG: hypothetical protein JO313_16780 [Verrucomicrobia bacterium]|nr:hypothetical protein [Verrucomicrobiota bacterium]
MDFQRLFKRKGEVPAAANASDDRSDSLYQKDVLIREGELLDGQLPPTLVWGNVGGVISIKADKILGILEGRTRIKAAALQELYPSLFERTPNPGAEYNIPLQVVVMQLKDIFAGISSEERAAVEDFDTPFGQLAREDEARFRDKQVDRPEVRPMATYKLSVSSELGSKAALKEGEQRTGEEQVTGSASKEGMQEKNTATGRNTDSDEVQSEEEKSTVNESSIIPVTLNEEIEENAKACGSDGSRRGPEAGANRAKQLQSPSKELEPRNVTSGNSRAASYARKSRDDNIRREGHFYLQELYLTDEPLDASRVADLILQLPRVTGVFIMLSDGGALGGRLNGAISETLLSLTPEFVKHLLTFTQNIEGGPSKFATFWVHARQISLSMVGNVFIVAEHEGKNLPPGLRERLVATAQALDNIYSSQP